MCAGVLLHLLAQAQRSHVEPDFLDVCQTFLLHPAFSGIIPAKRVLPVCGPDGVLFIVVKDHFINGVVFSFVTVHVVSFQLLLLVSDHDADCCGAATRLLFRLTAVKRLPHGDR